jgi:superfamily I DNA/RNA helicase
MTRNQTPPRRPNPAVGGKPPGSPGWKRFTVIGIADGIVPAPNALTEAVGDPVAYAWDLRRERCLLFVALTRARDQLYISYGNSPSAILG